MTSPAIWFDSTETGAPVINNANGAVVAALRAILVNGFNVKAITSIVVASGVATVTCPGHGFSSAYGKWLKISGASAPALDGVKKQTIVDANTFTYLAPGVADGSYTATDARRAPLGWSVAYADGGSTKIILHRTDPAATNIDLRVDDSGTAPATTTGARAIAVRGATGVDTYTSQAPTNAQVVGGLVCTKADNTAAAKRWLCIGTERDLWLFVCNPTATHYLPSLVFFDGVPYRPGDASFTVLACTSGSSTTSVSNLLFYHSVLSSTPGFGFNNGVIFSDELGLGVPEQIAVASPFQGAVFGSGVGGMPTDPLDFTTAFDLFMRGAKAGTRGTIPGLGEPFVSNTAVVFSNFLVQDTDTGGKLLLVKILANGTNTGLCAFKLSEDWR